MQARDPGDGITWSDAFFGRRRIDRITGWVVIAATVILGLELLVVISSGPRRFSFGAGLLVCGAIAVHQPAGLGDRLWPPSRRGSMPATPLGFASWVILGAGVLLLYATVVLAVGRHGFDVADAGLWFVLAAFLLLRLYGTINRSRTPGATRPAASGPPAAPGSAPTMTPPPPPRPRHLAPKQKAFLEAMRHKEP